MSTILVIIATYIVLKYVTLDADKMLSDAKQKYNTVTNKLKKGDE